MLGRGGRSPRSRCSARSSCRRPRTASPSSWSSAPAWSPGCSARSATRSPSQHAARTSRRSRPGCCPFEALYQAGLHGLTADTGGITGVIVSSARSAAPQRPGPGCGCGRVAYLGADRRRGARGVRPPRPLKATSPGSILDWVGALAPDSLLEGLNEPQREAVLHGDGPLLVLAGAGSGKTRVLTHRIAHLVATGQARPGEILAITFTNKAAQEMRERVELLVGDRAARDVGDDLPLRLRAHPARRGRAARLHARFTIYDEADSLRLVKRCLDELDIDPKRFTPRGDQVARSRDAKNQLLDAEAYREQVGSFFEQTAADVYELYEQRIHEMNAMDFDDLLFRTVNLLELFPEVARALPQHASATSSSTSTRTRTTRSTAGSSCSPGEHRNLCVVGDDDQSIYGFRGADIRNILDFERRLPGRRRSSSSSRTTARRRRSSRAANAVISNNRQPQGEGRSGPTSARATRCTSASSRTSTPRRASSPARSSGSSTRASSRDEIAVFYRTNAQCARARGHARPLRRRLPGDRRHEVLRARRDQGRARLPDAAREPARTPSRSRAS